MEYTNNFGNIITTPDLATTTTTTAVNTISTGQMFINNTVPLPADTITTTYTPLSDLLIKDWNIIIPVEPPYAFKYVKEIVPEKVYEFTFADDTKIKTICDEDDIFDLKYAFFLAIAKKLYSKEYTLPGVL